jgi:hypothetical protein
MTAKNAQVTLTVSLSAANQIISALNSRASEIVGLINMIQQQAAAQVAVPDPDIVPKEPNVG